MDWTCLVHTALHFMVLWHLSDAKCLNQSVTIHKRQFYYDGQSVTIMLESSGRASHEITNQVLKILLEEVIGYTRVEFQQEIHDLYNTSKVLNRLQGCTEYLPSGKCVVPKSMVNMEVPIPSNFNTEIWTNTGHIIDQGELGPISRLGFFIPTYTVQELWGNRIIPDSWRSFFLPDVSKKFSFKSKFSQLANLTLVPDSSKHFCKSHDCHHGLYYGSGCSIHDNACSVVFSSYPEFGASIIKGVIKELKLPLIVAWIGDNFVHFISEQLQKRLPILFFDLEPDVLSSTFSLRRVQLPSCLRVQNKVHGSCDFGQQTYRKFVWNKIQENIPEASELISKVTFSQSTYNNLLKDYNSNPSSFDVACRWLQDNQDVWKSWIPKNLSQKPRIYLLGMFPLRGGPWVQTGLKQGAELAVDRVNLDKTVLPKHYLDVIYVDSQCKADVAMKEFIRYVQNYTYSPIAGVLGPACSDEAEPIASLSKHFHMLTVSYGADAASLADRVNYPYFYRTIPQVNQNKVVYQQFFSHFKWKQVGLLAEKGQELPEYHTALQEYLKAHRMSVVVKRNIKPNVNDMEVSQVFADLRAQNVRIIIGDFSVITARAVMCEASRQMMTAHEGYVWFLPSSFSQNWWDVDVYNKLTHSQNTIPCTTNMMRYAVDGHFTLSKTFSSSLKTLVKGNLTVGQYKKQYAERVGKEGVPFNTYASFVYDAVWVYALALDSLLNSYPSALKSLHTERVTRLLVKYISKTTFRGISGEIQFNGSDRSGVINIMQFFHNGTSVIGSYVPGPRSLAGNLELELSKVKWLTQNGQPPTDGQKVAEQCLIEDFRRLFDTTCEMAIIIANVIGFGIFIILVLLVLLFIKHRYDQKMRNTHERMKELGLLSNDFARCFSLDDWEMPRDKVVLNRKLGEGAFGTVYGGEAYQDNELWVAVAVKTLKIGSRVEEKIDFLSEAEMMKRFNHPNIVQLLGVCTRGEPCLAIMEFHLHGDLKTYLLSRRNLVGMDCKEAEDIQSERLTRIALDIACGLRYIHDLKYVHRDLACRNCLVHSSGRVKIGDFGMTRPVIESDYYRFTKKGMLPVRWMSPESLSDGLFTAKSDIWSYGVLVFEIVTFGSFPYQGLCNSQVLEYVKSGGQLMLPRQCPEDLGNFILNCLAYEPMDRPEMEDIIDDLLKCHDFLIPCLDEPTTSVEDTETELLSSSRQNMTKSHSLTLTNLLNRLSNTSQDTKRLSGASQSGKLATPSKYSIKTFVPAILGRPRSNSLGTPQTSHKQNEYCEIHDESSTTSAEKSRRHSSEIHSDHLVDTGILLTDSYCPTNEKGDATSDYFSDNSKEIVQNLTFEFCQTITSL